MTNIEKHIQDLQSLVEKNKRLKEFNIRLMNILIKATLAAGGKLPLLYDEENDTTPIDYAKIAFLQGSNEDVLQMYIETPIIKKNDYIKSYRELPRIKEST